MTSLTQLDKIAAKWFHNQMRRRGFAVEKKFIFWRKRGPLYDMFLSHISSGGFLDVNVTIWSPWVDHPDGALGEFPPLSASIGGKISDEFPEEMRGGAMLSVEDEASIEESLKALLSLIDQYALPWFPTINSYETYISYIGDHGFYPSEARQEKLKIGIARGFEREPFL